MTALRDVADGAPVIEVPLLPTDIHDVDGVSRLAELLLR